jgi:hypothetical protein
MADPTDFFPINRLREGHRLRSASGNYYTVIATYPQILAVQTVHVTNLHSWEFVHEDGTRVPLTYPSERV